MMMAVSSLSVVIASGHNSLSMAGLSMLDTTIVPSDVCCVVLILIGCALIAAPAGMSLLSLHAHHYP